MLQNIIVFGLVLAALIYVVIALLKSVRKKDESPCGGCAGCDLKDELRKNASKDCTNFHSKSNGCCH